MSFASKRAAVKAKAGIHLLRKHVRRGIVMKKVLSMAALCAFGLCLLSGLPAKALAAFPEKEIRLIVPYRAGGQSDLTARKLAEVIQSEKLLPHPVIVVNIPGGNTQEGLRAAKAARPDGYTLLLHHSAFITMKALGQIRMGWSDFDMIGQTLAMSNSLVVNADSPFRKVSEFIAAAEREPGKYKIAIPGLGGVAHLALLDVLVRKGILDKVEIIPFDGANEAVTALMSKRVDMRSAPNADMARFVRSGEQRVLMVVGDGKLVGLDAPEYASDLGMENALILRNGVFAPRDTPEEAKAVIAEAVRRAVESVAFQTFAKQQVAEGTFLNAADWAKAFREDERNVTKLVELLVGN